MDSATRKCPILISLIFLISGINKIQNYYETVDWMEGFGVPGIFIIPAIILEIIAPILIIIGYYVKLSSILLALFCITTAIIFSNDFTDQMQTIGFLKKLDRPPVNTILYFFLVSVNIFSIIFSIKPTYPQ